MKLLWYTDSKSKKSDAETEKEVDRDAVAAETITVQEGTNSIEITVDQGIVPIETDTKSEDKQNPENSLNDFNERRYYEAQLRYSLIMGEWSRVESILERYKDMKTEALSTDGSTILHIAVGRGQNDFLKRLCSSITDEQLLHQRQNDGSTALHIAAMVGNKDATELLVKKNWRILQIEDWYGKQALHKAFENRHLDTIRYLLKAAYDAATTELQKYLVGYIHTDDEYGVDLLVSAISAKQYSFALELVEKFPMFASKKDDVLVAIARTFPSELDHWETLVYPPSMFLMDLNEARRVLGLVCIEIGKLENASSDPFSRPIIEAACQNAYHVVREILYHSSRAGLQSTDKNGHDIIQLAIINRSEKIYNLLYDIGERRNVYRTCKDSCGNNILHLAGKLAPSSVLNRRTGAALQLQRELQWFQEVEKFVFPSCTTQENIDKETPYKVFTREHKDLLKEGEQWMKTTAESCSITAALIVTIVFAAAITVPGGSNQEKGTPLFKSKVAFIIFAIADAISLFASSTALLVFLSILTTRFAEKDFLVSLPRRLFIGIFSLLLSTITMMVAFSATLFLVFCDNKPWMLAPICGLAFIPIAFFVSLQFPLMVDLLRSTYSSIFGAQRESTNLRILVNRILEKLGVWFAR
ncbi:putative ankyrin repeat-containing domain, PGG domain, ankyrin repeat-containing domain superfamily [Helianthus annuus]|nr:putative ankyrin repeat-containing domain, PGG domain, ankyrin repeat-containing domain superfamily [Helianthus annuus]